MWKEAEIFQNRKVILEKLEPYGFAKAEDGWSFVSDIMDGTFCVNVRVSKEGAVRYQVIDRASKEEYALAYAPLATGAFVGEVKAACGEVLQGIADDCGERCYFQSEDALRVIGYIRAAYGDEAEYLWDKFPHNAIFREPVSAKWYAALLSVEKRRLGIDEDGRVEVLDLRESSEQIAQLVDGERYLPGYHMNKKHWYTVRMDGSLSFDEICARIDASHASLPQPKQRREKKRAGQDSQRGQKL